MGTLATSVWLAISAAPWPVAAELRRSFGSPGPRLSPPLVFERPSLPASLAERFPPDLRWILKPVQLRVRFAAGRFARRLVVVVWPTPQDRRRWPGPFSPAVLWRRDWRRRAADYSEPLLPRLSLELVKSVRPPRRFAGRLFELPLKPPSRRIDLGSFCSKLSGLCSLLCKLSGFLLGEFLHCLGDLPARFL